MKEKIINLPDNKFIHVYDDLFTYAERQNYYNIARTSNFRITGSDGVLSQYIKQIFSQYGQEDLERLGITKSKGFSYLDEKYNLSQRNIAQMRVNCSMSTEDCNFHIDVKDGLTFLYYCNISWRPEWSGLTMWGSEDLKDIMYTSFCVPGRVVVFTGDIPHIVIPPHVATPVNRLTFIIQYTKL